MQGRWCGVLTPDRDYDSQPGQGFPGGPDGFASFVRSQVERLRPHDHIDATEDQELLINGRRLDIENLYRMVSHEPERAEEIVEFFLVQLFSAEASEVQDLSLDFARRRIMPRVQPESIFDHLNREMVAHVPYVNNTVIVFVTDLPQMTVSITTEQLLKWRVCAEELDEIARENLRSYAPELHVQLVDSREGGRAAIISEQDGYDAARLLMGDLFERLAPELGGDFLVGTPARDMFVAISRDPGPFVARLQERVTHDFSRLPYPITDQLFYVTRDGVAGTFAAAA
ncbi:MAG: DUF1444 family protein [Planctomycetota bacterium]